MASDRFCSPGPPRGAPPAAQRLVQQALARARRRLRRGRHRRARRERAAHVCRALALGAHAAQRHRRRALRAACHGARVRDGLPRHAAHVEQGATRRVGRRALVRRVARARDGAVRGDARPPPQARGLAAPHGHAAPARRGHDRGGARLRGLGRHGRAQGRGSPAVGVPGQRRRQPRPLRGALEPQPPVETARRGGAHDAEGARRRDGGRRAGEAAQHTLAASLHSPLSPRARRISPPPRPDLARR